MSDLSQFLLFDNEIFKLEKREKAKNFLIYGKNLQIRRYSQKKKQWVLSRLYLFEEDPTQLQWISEDKRFCKQRIQLRNVKDITITPLYNDFKTMKFKNIICVTYGENRFLALDFDKEETRNLWWQGIAYWVSQAIGLKKQKSRFDSNSIAKELFHKHDQDGNNILEINEIKILLKCLNCQINDEHLEKIIHHYDVNKSNSLDINEFNDVFHHIMNKSEAEHIFKRYCNVSEQELKNKDENYMDEKELQKFYEIEQSEKIDISIIRKKIQTYNKNIQKESDPSKLSFYNFCNILFNEENQVFDPKKSEIYQDMTQPLSDYWIKSSHNTYLLSNQLTGESSVQAYINAFHKGCRCVELDCWDGDNEEPIVYHGHTLTSKILFKDVIEAIKAHGFVINHYPIILSIENHCSLNFKNKMAFYLEKILGNIIFKLPKNWDQIKEFPSPNELKDRVLIKDKGELFNVEVIQDKNEENLVEDSDEEEKEEEIKKLAGSAKDTNKEKSQDLIKLITLFGVSLKLNDPKRTCWNISSLSEGKVKSVLSNKEKEILKLTQKSFIRTYPKGSRVDSSNYSPISAFNMGAQIIALNFQKNDKSLMLYHARFLQNGGLSSGYVLKPDFLRTGDKTFSDFKNPECLLKVTVISASQLKQHRQDNEDIIDPFIQIKIKGLPIEKKVNGIFKTKTIKNNGLNPIFDDQQTFKIHNKELAMIVFSVYDENNLKNDKTAFYSLPISCIRSGYRVVPLRNIETIEFLEFSYIFCHFEFMEINKKK